MSSQAKIGMILSKKPYSLMPYCFLHVTNVGKKWSRVTEFYLLGFFGGKGLAALRRGGGDAMVTRGRSKMFQKQKKCVKNLFLASLSVSLNKGEVVSLFYGCRKIACVLSFCRKFAG